MVLLPGLAALDQLLSVRAISYVGKGSPLEKERHGQP